MRNSFLTRCKKLALWKQTAARIDQSWIPWPSRWFETFDPITADFTYVRQLGDGKGILLASISVLSSQDSRRRLCGFERQLFRSTLCSHTSADVSSPPCQDRWDNSSTLFNEQGESLWARRTYRHLADHCLRSGLTSDAGPFECPPTVRGRKLLGRQSLSQFSFVCSLKILVSELDLQDKAIGFSSSPPRDRSCGSEACSKDGNAVAAIEWVIVKNELGNAHPNPCLSRLTHFPSGRIDGGDMVHLPCHCLPTIRTSPEIVWG